MKFSTLFLILIFTGTGAIAQNPVTQWAKGFGSAYLGNGQSIASDPSGNVYATGAFSGAGLTFGNDTLINTAMDSAENMFLVKYDSSGNPLWAKSAGGGANSGTFDVAGTALGTDANGNVYVLGSFQSPLAIFGNDTLVSTNIYVYLVKYNPQGNALWAVNVGGTLNNSDNIVVDANGNSYISGYFTSGSIIGGTDTLPLKGYIEAFVIKYDSSGNSVWAAGIYGDNNVFNNAVALDAEGNVYVTGSYSGDSVVAGNNTLYNTGAAGMYTVKYNSTGQVAWAKNVSVSANIYPNAISADGLGNVYITGNTTADTIVFGADTAFTFSTSALSNIFVAGYDASGNTRWARCTQNSNNIAATGISADAGGNVFVTGSFIGSSVQIGSNTLINNENINQSQALFVAEFNTEGNVIWTTGGLAAETDLDGGIALQTDNKGHLYVSGSYAGPSVNFGNDTLPFVGSVVTQSNVFVAKYHIAEISTGITDPVSGNNIVVYPNPSSGSFVFKGITAGNMLEVYDMLGQRIYTATAIADNYALNIPAEAKGVYLYRVTDGTATLQQGKIVLQ